MVTFPTLDCGERIGTIGEGVVQVLRHTQSMCSTPNPIMVVNGHQEKMKKKKNPNKSIK